MSLGFDKQRPSMLRDVALIVVVGLVVLFSNLGGPRLWDRDEPRNAGCAWEMQQRGDWIVPWFNDELRTHKPALLYWIILSAYQLFGVSEFSARFGSAALSIGTALLTYGIGRRVFDARTGRWAAIILISTLMFDVAGRAATPDATLIFCVTLALAAFVLGEFPRAGDRATSWDGGRIGCGPLRWRTAFTMYGAMGLAVLAKGPVGLILPTAVIGMYLLIARLPSIETVDAATAGSPSPWFQRLLSFGRTVLRPFAPKHFLATCWDMRPLTALAIACAVAAPWYVAVGLRTDGEFLRGFFWQHNIARAMQSFEGHRGGPWFYPAAILVGFFPWSIFAVPIVLDVKRRMGRGESLPPGLVFALCWAIVWVSVFSVAKTKLPSYVTPSYPGLAMVAAAFLVRWTDRQAEVDERWSQFALAILAVVGAGLVIALPLVASRFLPGEQWLGAIGLVLLVGGVGAIIYRRRGTDAVASRVIALTAVSFTTLLFAVAAQRVDRHQHSDQILAAIERFDAQARVGSLGGFEPTWVFYGRRPIQELTLAPDADREATIVAGARPSPFTPKPTLDAREFLQADEHRCLITTDRQLAELQEALPGQIEVLATAPRFLKPGQLVVVKLADPARRALATRAGRPRG